jgi:hypothetical protein
MLQRDDVLMVKMKVLVMVMMMMIPMKSSSMTVAMATISPHQEGISPADFCLPESFLSLYVFRPAEVAESISDPPVLGFRGQQYMREGAGRSGPGWPHHWVAWPGAGPRHLVVWAPGYSPRSLLLATFIF